MRQRLLLLALLTASTAAVAQSAPSPDNGKTVFAKWCAPCHGATITEGGLFGGGPLPGTAALGVKYKGQLPAVLEERTDLTPQLIRAVVRGGLFGMPITRKTEISDAELEDIIAYLTNKKAR
jgi:mono/diheme cytochrome c family protein